MLAYRRMGWSTKVSIVRGDEDYPYQYLETLVDSCSVTRGSKSNQICIFSGKNLIGGRIDRLRIPMVIANSVLIRVLAVRRFPGLRQTGRCSRFLFLTKVSDQESGRQVLPSPWIMLGGVRGRFCTIACFSTLLFMVLWFLAVSHWQLESGSETVVGRLE